MHTKALRPARSLQMLGCRSALSMREKLGALAPRCSKVGSLSCHYMHQQQSSVQLQSSTISGECLFWALHR